MHHDPMPTPDSSYWRMANRLAGGKLAEVIAARIDEGDSIRAVTRHLLVEFGIEATDKTVGAWADALIGTGDAA